MKLDETRIQYHLSHLLLKKQHVYVIPNVSYSWLNWEADLVSITRSMFLYEYEIKISVSDFKNDFKKRKHRWLKNPGSGTNRMRMRMPNYFTYVAPVEAIPLCIPDYAGLIEVRINGRYQNLMEFIEIKKPRKIHDIRQDEKSILKMLRTLMYKYLNLAQSLETNKIQRELVIPYRGTEEK